jgi:type III secretory pathway component EscT
MPRLVRLGLVVLAGVWTAAAVGPLVALEWAALAREAVLGLALGIAAAIPVLAAQTAGRLIDANVRPHSNFYDAVFGVFAVATFVGIDGHVAFATGIIESHRATAGLAQTHALDALATLIPIAVQLAVPWLITAAIVEVALGVGGRLAAQAATFSPIAAAVPAALAMMTAALIATLGVVIAAAIRGTP